MLITDCMVRWLLPGVLVCLLTRTTPTSGSYATCFMNAPPLREHPLREHPLREHPLRVLVFWDTECPICQQTTGRIQTMANLYGSRVQFTAVYPTETVTPAEVNAFEREYKVSLPHLLDPAHKLVKQYNVTTTPEVLLLSAQNRILYRGSIDDQFYRLGRSRPQPTVFYLKNALEAVLANKPVPLKQTTPTGCLINRG